MQIDVKNTIAHVDFNCEAHQSVENKKTLRISFRAKYGCGLMLKFYEFFAGGGMVRAGLGKDWACLFANDLDPKKCAAYAKNWSGEHLSIGDVAEVTTSNLAGSANLVWASFPCQDLSLAGKGKGLQGDRSGTFWPF